MRAIARFIATVLYAGYCPVAPGTAGSAIAAACYWLLPEMETRVYLLFLIVLILVGVWASFLAEKTYGHDASVIVIDEFTGVFVSLFLLPKAWLLIMAGFFVFRFFDILKPYPLRLAERLKGGWGVMADDVLAGIYTNCLLRLFVWILR